MKTPNVALTDSSFSQPVADELFRFSIRKIASDVQLQEMKTGKAITTIAFVGSFDNDGSKDITGHVSREFAGRGYETLLLSISKDLYESEYKKSRDISEALLSKTQVDKLDFLAIDESSRFQDFSMGRAALCGLIDSLKGKYKRIVIGTPPLEDDLSGFMSAMVADGTYFICDSKSNRWNEMQKHYANLKSVGANIFGVVYNNAEQRIVKKLYRLSRKHN